MLSALTFSPDWIMEILSFECFEVSWPDNKILIWIGKMSGKNIMSVKTIWSMEGSLGHEEMPY